MLRNFMNKELLLQALSQICFGMLGTLLVLAIVHKTPLTIATVNITALEDSFIQETSKQSLRDEEKKQKVTAFADALNQTVVRLAKEKNLVLVPSQAVISDVPDLTQEVAEQIKKGMS